MHNIKLYQLILSIVLVHSGNIQLKGRTKNLTNYNRFQVINWQNMLALPFAIKRNLFWSFNLDLAVFKAKSY